MNESILVTGGAGFIGSHLCQDLLNRDKKVIIIDNFNDFYDPQIKRKNINKMEKLIVEEGDIRDIEFLDDVFGRNNIKMVVHLAAMAGVRPSIADPILYSDVNIKGTVNILEMCKKHNIGKFIFASSSSVYGNNDKVPFSEGDNVDFPISPYAATKKYGELLCHVYHKLYDIDIACLRFFTVYGPRQRPDLAIHKFTKLIFNDKEISVYGDGSTERDYTYIDDIVDGIVKSIEWLNKGNGNYEIFNLGEFNTVTLEYLIETLEKTIGKKIEIKRLPIQPGDVKRTYADIDKSRKILGYNPSIDFEEGIRKFVNWYKRENNIK